MKEKRGLATSPALPTGVADAHARSLLWPSTVKPQTSTYGLLESFCSLINYCRDDTTY